MHGSIKYPFVPKSTVSLLPGQFWSFPLLGNRYACGRVLQLRYNADGKQDTRMFLAGLLDWCDHTPPTFESIAGAKLIAHGSAHTRAISMNSGQVLGLRPLELDAIEIPLTLDSQGGSGCRIRRGYELLDLASEEQLNTLKVFSTWGYQVINVIAEHHFLRSNPAVKSLTLVAGAPLKRRPLP